MRYSPATVHNQRCIRPQAPMRILFVHQNFPAQYRYLAATLAQRPGTNLLQGAYAPKSNWSAMAKPWRLAASLAGGRRYLVASLWRRGDEVILP